jgi:isoleucyl-tRNA synthetase
VAEAIASADAAALAASLAERGQATVQVGDEQVEVGVDEVVLTERPREGWSVVNEQGETIALDLELTDDLVRAGLAREVVRLVQEARKSSGFDVSDRITLTWRADGDLALALREHADAVAAEVLATSVTEGEPEGDVREESELGLAFSVERV